MDRFFILLTLFSIPSIITVPYFDGLSQDFSNLIIEVTSGGQISYPPYQIAQFEPGQWAEVNVTLPEENYTISLLASFTGEAPAPQNPEEQELPENLPQDSFNITEQNGTTITFYFNLTEGNLSEQPNLSENQTVLYTFDFNLTQNETPASQLETNLTHNETFQPEPQQGQNITQNESLPLQDETSLTANETQSGANLTLNETIFPPPPLQENQSIPSITQANVTYFPGLAPDFSNLIVQIVVGAVRANLPYSILQFIPSEWALVQFEVPTDEPHTFEFYAALQNASNETNPPANLSASEPELLNLTNYTLNVSWFPPLAPDFSNLLVQFAYPDGSISNISHGILSMSISEWALILLKEPMAPDVPVSLLAMQEEEPPATAPEDFWAGEEEQWTGQPILIEGCQELGKPGGYYMLKQPISGSAKDGACLRITAPDVRLDCKKNSITAADPAVTGHNAGTAIYSGQPGTWIRNCQINNFDDGIVLVSGADSARLFRLSFESQLTSNAIRISGASNGDFKRITTSGNARPLQHDSGSNNTLDCQAQPAQWDAFIWGDSQGITVKDCIFPNGAVVFETGSSGIAEGNTLSCSLEWCQPLYVNQARVRFAGNTVTSLTPPSGEPPTAVYLNEAYGSSLEGNTIAVSAGGTPIMVLPSQDSISMQGNVITWLER